MTGCGLYNCVWSLAETVHPECHLNPLNFVPGETQISFPLVKWNQAPGSEEQITHSLPLHTIHVLWHVNDSKKYLCLRQFKQVSYGSWIKRDQLDVTCFIISLFNAQHVSDVLTSETCWALNNEIIKQVTSSCSLFIQHIPCLDTCASLCHHFLHLHWI